MKGKKNLWQPRTFHARFKQPSQKPVQQAHVIQPSDRDLKLKPGCNRTHFQSSSCWQTQREDKNLLSITRNYWLQWEAKHWERVLTFTSVESRTDEWMFLAIGWQEYFGKWNQVLGYAQENNWCPEALAFLWNCKFLNSLNSKFKLRERRATTSGFI